MATKKCYWIILLLLYSAIITLASEIINLQYDATVLIKEIIRGSNGDILYKDYLSGFGLIAAYIGILPIKILKLDPIIVISVYGIIQNIIASFVIYGFLKKAGANEGSAIFGGFITATWFTPQVGGIYYDNIAVLIGLVGFYIILDNIGNFSKDKLKYLFSGFIIALALFTKQNSGGVLGIAALIVILIYGDYKNLIIFIVGYFIAIIIYLFICYLNGQLDQFLYHGFTRISEYNQNESRLSFERIANLIIRPYGINIFDFFKLGAGQYLFLLNYLFYYFYTVILIKSIIQFDHSKIIITFFWLSLMGVTLVVGRGMLEVQYFIGFISIISMVKISVNKYIFSVFSIFLIIAGGLFFILSGGNWSINHERNYKDRVQLRLSQITNNDTDIKKLADQIGSNKKVSMIGVGFTGSLFDMYKFMPTNYINFWIPYVAQENYAEWSRLEAINIKTHNPDFVIISAHYAESLLRQYQLKIILEREYYLYADEVNFLIFKKK